MHLALQSCRMPASGKAAPPCFTRQSHGAPSSHAKFHQQHRMWHLGGGKSGGGDSGGGNCGGGLLQTHYISMHLALQSCRMPLSGKAAPPCFTGQSHDAPSSHAKPISSRMWHLGGGRSGGGDSGGGNCGGGLLHMQHTNISRPAMNLLCLASSHANTQMPSNVCVCQALASHAKP